MSRSSLIPIIIAAVATTIAQALRYIALDYTPISMVTPIIGTSTLFVFPLSFIINRQIEAFNLRIIMGGIATVAGVFLMFWIS